MLYSLKEEFKDTKGVIIIHKSNGRKDKQRYIQSTSQKTKDRATRTPLRIGVNPGAPEWLAVPEALVCIHQTCYIFNVFHFIFVGNCVPCSPDTFKATNNFDLCISKTK